MTEIDAAVPTAVTTWLDQVECTFAAMAEQLDALLKDFDMPGSKDVAAAWMVECVSGVTAAGLAGVRRLKLPDAADESQGV